MSYIKDVNVKSTDSPSIDAFGRWRVSEPLTLFDSKQLHDNQPLFWDDSETGGSGTSSSHSTNTASTTLSVGATTAGTRVRQTFQRFNYQPGKSQLVLITGVLDKSGGGAGITRRMGMFDGENGIFLEDDGGQYNIVRRTYTSGSTVDNEVSQSSWNLDTMDGSGASGIDLDFSKTQILVIDFEWLGVGRVRVGFNVDGNTYYAHEFLNANSLTSVYMSTPNLPIRYEVSNSGSGDASSLEHICASVISEGGLQNNGTLRHKKSGAISSLSSGTTYALVGIRLQSAKTDSSILMEAVSLISSTVNDNCAWSLKWKPTVAGTFTYSDVTNSTVQTATGSSSNTVTGGTDIAGGYFSTSSPTTSSLPNALKLGADIAGTTLDTIVLCVTPITNNITVHGSLTWRELS